ncbi:MAG: CRTAC1 family protein, partial [Myxococcota bacterium]
FDNDGRLDVYIGASDYPGNRGNLYHQADPMRFEAVATADFFEHNRSHGVVVADFDRDGDLDIVVGHSRFRCNAELPNNCYATPQIRAFENVMGGNFLQLALEGAPGTNRAAIGAQVLVRYGELVQRLEVDGGHGHFGSQSDLVQHVGLGAACEAEVEVRWPDAALTTETYTLPAGHRFRIVQGEPPVLAD